jgi:anaerobic dimethyl sulfoxide reductase subunit A
MANNNIITKALHETVLTRRSFLKWSAAIGGTAALAGGLTYGLKASEKIAENTDDGEWVVAPCWNNCGGRCVNYALVKDGVVVRQKTDDTHPDSWLYPQQRACARGRSRRTEAYNVGRLKYPMKRRNWEPGGGKKELRGKDEWVRISWDEALDIIAGEEKRIREKYGDGSIFYNTLMKAGLESGRIDRHLGLTGGYSQEYITGSMGTWAATGQWIMDTALKGHIVGNDRMENLKTDLWIIDGLNPAWGSMGNPTYLFKELKRVSGAKMIWIDPFYHDSVAALGDEWIPIRPSTDHAMFLGLAYTLITEDDPVNKPLIDWDFLNRCTVGFDKDNMPADAKDPSENFKDYVLGLDADGNLAPEDHKNYPPKTPQWASEICGVPAPRIRSLAIEIGSTKNVAIISGTAPARAKNQDSYPQMLMTLGWMTGHFGREGSMTAGSQFHIAFGGLGPRVGWELSNCYPKAMPIVGYDVSGVPGIKNPSVPPVNWWKEIVTGYGINENDLPSALIDKKFTAAENDVRNVNIQMVVGCGANSFSNNVGLAKNIEGLRSVEFVLSADYQLTTIAKYSDIVLPMTHPWERYGDVSFANREIGFVWGSKVTEPMYEAKDPGWIDKEIAMRLGVDPEEYNFPSGKQQIFNRISGAKVMKGEVPGSVPDYEPLVTITEKDIAELGVEGEPQQGKLSYKELKKKGFYQVPRSPDDNFGRVAYKEYRDDPEGNPMSTASGKCEIHCQGLADFIAKRGYTKIRPIPTYNPSIEGYEATFSDWENKVKGPYPLQLYSPHYPRRSHSDFDQVPWLRRAFPNPLFMNTLDAKERGIENGDPVLITSAHGKSLRPVEVTERVMPGVVLLPHGAWVEVDEETQIDKAGTDNWIGGALPTGQGTGGYNTNIVQVEKYNGPVKLDPDWKWPARVVEYKEK